MSICLTLSYIWQVSYLYRCSCPKKSHYSVQYRFSMVAVNCVLTTWFSHFHQILCHFA